MTEKVEIEQFTVTVDGGGERKDTGKKTVELIPVEWIWGLSCVMTSGATKYAARNWERGMKWSKMIGPLLRHVFKFMMGERYDPETGNHHMFMAAWNCLGLASYDLRGIGENDLEQRGMDFYKLIKVPGTEDDSQAI